MMIREEMIEALKEFCSKRDCFYGNHTGDIKKCPLIDIRSCEFSLLDDAELNHVFEMAFNNKSNSITVTIPADATNGDILRMVFPNMRYLILDSIDIKRIVFTNIGRFDIDWWNASYKAESE